MKFNKTTYIVIGGSLVLLVGFFIFIFLNQNKDTQAPSDSATKESIITDSNSNSNNTSDFVQDSSFEELKFTVDKSMQGKADYFQQEMFIEFAKSDKEQYKLTPTLKEDGSLNKTTTGHTLYKSTDGTLFIISGFRPVEYANGRISPVNYLREEDTGVRIRTFNTEDELTRFNQSYESGSRILSGKTDAEKGSVIVDGCLTDIKYVENNETIYFNILNVLQQILPTATYTNGSGGLHVLPNEFVSIQVPTNAAGSALRKSLSVVGDKFTFRSWNGEKFEYKAQVLEESDMLMSAQDACTMFGWHMYTNGNVLSIVSDKLNVTNKGTVYSFTGDSGYELRVEADANGDLFINQYDNRGVIIASWPYVDEGVDQPRPEASNGAQGAGGTTTSTAPQNPSQSNSGEDMWDDGYGV